MTVMMFRVKRDLRRSTIGKIPFATLLIAAFCARRTLAADAPLDFEFKGVGAAKSATACFTVTSHLSMEIL